MEPERRPIRVEPREAGQALNAILFFYEHVLRKKLGLVEGVVCANRPERVPLVLSKEEVRRVLAHMSGVPRLQAMLLYGSGLRLLECCRLRVKDLDWDQNQLVVRAGKGNKDRYTTFPAAIKEPLRAHLASVERQHQEDLALGLGRVELPNALARKYPNADKEWGWQWVFPATSHSPTTRPVRGAATTSMNPSSSAPSKKPASRPASPSPRAATRSAIPSPPTSWKTATTSAPSRSCSAIPT